MTTSSFASSRPQSPAPADPDLQAVIAVWPGLPEAVKAGIVAMVKAAASTKPEGEPR